MFHKCQHQAVKEISLFTDDKQYQYFGPIGLLLLVYFIFLYLYGISSCLQIYIFFNINPMKNVS